MRKGENKEKGGGEGEIEKEYEGKTGKQFDICQVWLTIQNLMTEEIRYFSNPPTPTKRERESGRKRNEKGKGIMEEEGIYSFSAKF